MAKLLLEDGVRRFTSPRVQSDDTPGADLAALAMAGRAFDWLAAEPDIYDDTCGERV